MCPRAAAREGEEGGKVMQCGQLVASLEAALVTALAGLGEAGWAVVARMA